MTYEKRVLDTLFLIIWSWNKQKRKLLRTSFFATVKLLDPVFSAVWGLLLFQEKPTVLVILGGVIVIAGVFIYGRATEEE